MFVLDDGGDEVPVRAEDVTAWHKAAAELWRAARVNLEAEWDAAQRHVQPLDRGEARIIAGASPYVSSLLLRLDDLRDLPPSGALVAVPHRRALVVTPLEPLAEAVRLVPEMAALARGLHVAGPDPISPDVFWWRFGAPLLPASAATSRV